MTNVNELRPDNHPEGSAVQRRRRKDYELGSKRSALTHAADCPLRPMNVKGCASRTATNKGSFAFRFLPPSDP
jgi:hypothetical protein